MQRVEWVTDRMAVRSDGNPIGWPSDLVVTRSSGSDDLSFGVSFRALGFAMRLSEFRVYDAID
ncbi:hypothetical protein HanIR_Chr09g0419651 [Helianthus annuus]|nr:hypothetical protein HanIR_Chr09g0419651 [Helianthus annuus]